jgi:hypothetical protein
LFSESTILLSMLGMAYAKKWFSYMMLRKKKNNKSLFSYQRGKNISLVLLMS